MSEQSKQSPFVDRWGPVIALGIIVVGVWLDASWLNEATHRIENSPLETPKALGVLAAKSGFLGACAAVFAAGVALRNDNFGKFLNVAAAVLIAVAAAIVFLAAR